MDSPLEYVYALQALVFEHLVQPLVLALGMGGFLVDAFDGTLWLLAGIAQIAVLLLVIGPLQKRIPVQQQLDSHSVRTDVLYTLVHRLGLFKVAMFFWVEPWVDSLLGWARLWGVPTLQLDQLVPGLTDLPVVSFFLYLIVLDGLNYGIHRAQHSVEWWWRLHALHHSQQSMSMWTDNRNHLLDSALVDIIFVLVAYVIGVPPGQFLLLVAISQLMESFQHANVAISYGRLGERLLISPRFHRLHHSIGTGHESKGRHTLGGYNFGVLFPWWDLLAKTANFDNRFDATGVRDQLEQGRDYGQGFWQQQWLGLLRLFGRA
jgi:sterol desaturase/sphingolipid hydroxylase (fatty acid hydroxylase superfamily)